MLVTIRRGLVYLALAALVAFGGQAFAAIVAVGNCTALVNFATIQQAVDAVPPGSSIQVCPGTYHEQVNISQKVTITGIMYAGTDRVLIVPPSSGLVANTVSVDNASLPMAAQIWVHDTIGPVLISNVTVDGSNNQITSCAPDLVGILFQNASGTLNHIATRNQTLGSGLGGCQSGLGIFVQSATGQTSTVSVLASSVHQYNKNGITGNDAGTTLTATGNYVQGSGVVASPGAAQNGIQIGRGATGKISANTVIDNIYGDPTIAGSSDILLYNTDEVTPPTVSLNLVGNSQYPIAIYIDTASTGDGATISSNKIMGTAAYDAIDVCSNGNTVKSNIIFDSAESGIHLDASCSGTGNNNTVTTNTMLESDCAGILSDPGTTGNTVGSQTYYTVPFQKATSTSKCTISQGPRAPQQGGKFSPVK
jgi:parallel beta-helix repeat protein